MRLPLMLPVRLAHDTGVKLLLFKEPSPTLHRALNELKFTQLRYGDERLGSAGEMKQAMEVALEHKNSIWQTKLVGDYETGEVIGDLLTHARAYEPEATAAIPVGRLRFGSGDTIVTFRDEYVVWTKVMLEVTTA